METNIDNKINFKLQRDFGELISTTFGFFKQEFGILKKPLLYYLAPALLIANILFSFLIKNTFQINFNMEENYNINRMIQLYVDAIGMMFFYGIISFIIQVIMYSYIKEYIDSNRKVDLTNVKNNFFKFIMPAIGWTILYTFLSGLGFILVFPGIYLIIAFQLTIPAVFFNKSEKGHLGRSMVLVRGNWWFTFGLLIVFGLLLGAAQMFLQIPIYIITGITAFNGIKSGNLSGSIIRPTLFVTLYTDIIQTITMLMNSMYSVLLALYYFSLVEKKEMPSLMDRLQNIIPVQNSGNSFIVEGK